MTSTGAGFSSLGYCCNIGTSCIISFVVGRLITTAAGLCESDYVVTKLRFETSKAIPQALSFLKQTQQEGRKEVSHITSHSTGRGQQHTADAAETD
jgi:hypothetical protein